MVSLLCTIGPFELKHHPLGPAQTNHEVVLMKDVHEMLKLRFSLNFYMFHGGTNFGFMGGAESLDVNLPAVTSYDYGALLTENGNYTPEYLVFQELLHSVAGLFSIAEVPTALPPERISKVVYKSVTRFHFMSLWEILPYVDQGSEAHGPSVILLRSWALLQEQPRKSVDSAGSALQGIHILRILVENQGRLAYGTDISKERKGLIGDIYLDNSPLKKFMIYSLDLKTAFIQKFNWSSLTPPRLQHRSLGLRTASTTTGRAHFTLEGHKFLIFGGSIHYFRVPRQYWRDRLLKLKACGFNTVTTAFVLLAAEIGLWVILRPGPYICAEIDLGGLPSWLLQDPKTQLRTTEKSFVDAVDKYFDQLIPRMLPLQYQQGGPVIAVQVENEYGSFNKDKHYMAYLKEINKPILVMEYWVGWFDNWGRPHSRKSVLEVESTVSSFIKHEISFNLYMFHGGTNFGFMNAAGSFDEKHIGVVTSYGKYYDALLTEAGDYTEKYFKLRKLLGTASGASTSVMQTFVSQVFLNETLLGFLHEDMWNLDIPTFRGCGLLRILVENQGRIDFSWKIQDERKGLVHSVCIDGVYLKGFTIYSLEMKMSFFERLRSATWRPVSEKYVGPAFYQGTLRAGYSPRDTFLSLLSWHRGFVFINGYNLGRYWKIGPQKTLYLPGVWLHPGPNEIILFEMMTSGSYIQSKDEPQLE
ncbi:Beta-galactosidase-1-like protein 3 [Fukomys damarensis]|uniref:Beta-galactosidase n=1 Tax=Fukomys damarensis TaxID=885580 RepID=A0A091E438_FUKDA|nr:Beta-galactosidase-1-like protein 3 [Fukomys damarensis]